MQRWARRLFATGAAPHNTFIGPPRYNMLFEQRSLPDISKIKRARLLAMIALDRESFTWRYTFVRLRAGHTIISAFLLLFLKYTKSRHFITAMRRYRATGAYFITRPPTAILILGSINEGNKAKSIWCHSLTEAFACIEYFSTLMNTGEYSRIISVAATNALIWCEFRFWHNNTHKVCYSAAAQIRITKSTWCHA